MGRDRYQLVTASHRSHYGTVSRIAGPVAVLFVSLAPTTNLLPSAEANNNKLLIAANPAASSSSMTHAIGLYNQHLYEKSAEAFESLIRTTKPSARLYYYAALASRAAKKSLRCKQLFEHLVKAYPSSKEAAYAKGVLAQIQQEATAQAGSSPESELPESVKNALPPEVRALLGTAAGQQALKTAMAQQAGNIKIVKEAESKGILNKNNPMGLVNAAPPTKTTRPDRPFTAADIARFGAAGIDQFRYPNCWFEASMSALAELPRGQKLISNTIRYGDKGSYMVRFPNDGKEYKITDADMAATGIHDKALWASILECAEVKKFPNNTGAEGAGNDQSRLEVGLESITGAKAEILTPSAATVQELSTFIGGAVKSQNPIVCGTHPAYALSSLPEIVVPQHAYTITGFEPDKGLVIMRNPHGVNSERFELEKDPQHLEFEQLNDGAFKISVPLFQKYFNQICRSFI